MDDGLSLRELVLEVRQDVKALNQKVDAIDRTGSIGTREELNDHETRLRTMEQRTWSKAGIGTYAGALGTVLGAAAGALVSFFGPH